MSYFMNFTDISYEQGAVSGITTPPLYFNDYHPFSHIHPLDEDVVDLGPGQGSQMFSLGIEEPEYNKDAIPDGEIGLYVFNYGVIKDGNKGAQSETPDSTPPTSPQSRPRSLKCDEKKPYKRVDRAPVVCECLLRDGTKCGAKLSYANPVATHFRDHHPVDEQLDQKQRPFVQCMWPGCTNTQADRASLVQHLRKKHLETTKSEICPCCDRAFATFSELRRHQRTLKYQRYIASLAASCHFC